MRCDGAACLIVMHTLPRAQHCKVLVLCHPKFGPGGCFNSALATGMFSRLYFSHASLTQMLKWGVTVVIQGRGQGSVQAEGVRLHGSFTLGPHYGCTLLLPPCLCCLAHSSDSAAADLACLAERERSPIRPCRRPLPLPPCWAFAVAASLPPTACSGAAGAEFLPADVEGLPGGKAWLASPEALALLALGCWCMEVEA